MPEFQTEGASVSFWLRVKPRASRERLTVDSSGELRLELHAPALEGQANEACILFLARGLRLPQACIVMLSGHKARRKLLRVTGHSPEETIHAIRALASSLPGKKPKPRMEIPASPGTSKPPFPLPKSPREELKP